LGMNPFYQGGQFEEPIDADAALSKELTRNLSVGPTLHATAYVHAKAVVIGNVTVGAKFRRIWRFYLLLLGTIFATCDGEYNGNGQYLMTHA